MNQKMFEGILWKIYRKSLKSGQNINEMFKKSFEILKNN